MINYYNSYSPLLCKNYKGTPISVLIYIFVFFTARIQTMMHDETKYNNIVQSDIQGFFLIQKRIC